jgi:hypothetical protein
MLYPFFFLIRFTNVSCLAPSEWCTIEHWVTLGCLYVGALFYSLLISSMSSILEVANKASQQFQQKLAQIDDYMRNKKLPPALREKVKEYFRMQHNEGKVYDETSKAGIKLYVLTGDKRETAIEIGYSTKVLTPSMSLFQVAADGSHGGMLLSEADRVRTLIASEFLRLVKTGKHLTLKVELSIHLYSVCHIIPQ